jgi:gluconolactonase
MCTNRTQLHKPFTAVFVSMLASRALCFNSPPMLKTWNIFLLLCALHAGAVEIIAHRGASWDAPENTLSSMKLAWQQGADAIELDLWLSKDGKLVVFHDADTKRFEDTARKVPDLTWEELQQLDVGNLKGAQFKGERIPTLESILATVPTGRRAVLELKSGPEILRELKRVLEASGKNSNDLAIISFRRDTLTESKKVFPTLEHYFVHGFKKDATTGQYPDLREMIRLAREANAQGLDLHFDWPITKTFVDQLRLVGLKLIVWTVNDPLVASRLVEAGVDGITTDRPQLIRDALLFVARPLTPPMVFTSGIEGPACDREGNIYAVNLERQQTIGKVAPSGEAVVWVTLPGNSTGNGIRFWTNGMMYVADYVGHNVLQIDPMTRAVSVFASNNVMNQPNDLAVAPNGTLYASDPNWKDGTGQLWRIDRDGKTEKLAEKMGTTNGIEVSPDGSTLYVNESVQRTIWAFTIRERRLQNKRLLIKFDDFGFDGMRCDVDGNLYVTRHGKGTVAKISPQGVVLKEIDVLGPHPTNICFGGADGRTAYVTEAKQCRLVQFRVDRPGLEWQRWQKK